MGFSPKQLEVLKFGYTDYDAIICDGSIRSGKSSVLSIAFVLWAMNTFNSKNFIIGSQSVASAERNIIKPLLEIKYLKEHFDVRYSISNRCLIVTKGNKINYFYLFGGKDESSYQTVQGITAAGAFLDEVVLMPESFVNQVLARCSVEGSKYWFSCNPANPSHWFYIEWVKKAQQRNVKYLHFTLEDNPSLSETVIERYKSMYTGVFYERYILGLWTMAEGLIYKIFANDKERYLLDTVPKDLIFLNVGIDFGGTKSGHTFVATGFTKMMKQVIVLEAKRYEEEMSPEELDKVFVDFCQMVYKKYGMYFNARCDNAEPVLIRGFKNATIRHGLHTHVKNALKRPIKDRIDTVIKLLGLNRLFFMRETTVPLQLGLAEAVWDSKKEDTRLDNGTSDIDILDAFEYSIEEYINDLIDSE